jgi:hypothetical protein
MRGVLLPLAAMAERVGAAVVAIAHLNKATKETARKALYRTTGSIALPAAARMAFIIGEHPEDRDRRVVVHQKNNLAPVPPTLGFRVVATVDQVARVVWDPSPVAGLTADDVVTTESPDPETPAAVAFLDALVPPGAEVPAAEARRQAEAEGFPETTARRGRQRLGIRVERRGFGRAGEWFWVRPAIDATIDATVPVSGGNGVYGVYGVSAKTPPPSIDATQKRGSGAYVASLEESTTYNTPPPIDATLRDTPRARARGAERLIECPAKSYLRARMPTDKEAE